MLRGTKNNSLKPSIISKYKKGAIVVIAMTLSAIVITSCAVLKDKANQIKGNLIGQSFNMQFFDDYGDNTLTINGSKVTIGAVTNTTKSKDKDGNTTTTENTTSVLDITINGKQVLQVGNTMVCLEDGISMIKGADIPSSIDEKSGGGFVPFDRSINKIKNKLGTKKTVVISSQQGVPIGVVQGNEVYATVPSDLPKMTRLNVDGKSVYIHRANYVILDTDLIK